MSVAGWTLITLGRDRGILLDLVALAVRVLVGVLAVVGGALAVWQNAHTGA